MAEISLTEHAARRKSQRGIITDALRLVIDEHDLCLEAGGGCSTLRLTRRRLRDLRAEGYPAAVIERAQSVVVVRCDDDGSIVTVLRDRGRAARAYRRQMPTKRTSPSLAA